MATRIDVATVRQLAIAAGIRPAEDELERLAEGLRMAIEAIDRADHLGIERHEPATAFRLSGGAVDEQL
jgi:hypothetical protein